MSTKAGQCEAVAYSDHNQAINPVGSGEDLVARFLADGRPRGISRHTIRTYESHLRPLIIYSKISSIPITAMTQADLKNFIAIQMAKELSPVTINDYIRTFRHLFRWMVSEGIIKREPSLNIKKLKVPRREKPVLGLDEVTKLLNACSERTFEGIRNRAIIRLMWDAGLRRGEIAGARLEDFDIRNARLGVLGKGDKFAWVTLSSATISSLELWLGKRKRHKSPYVFIGKSGNPLSCSWITHMIIKLGKSAGLSVYPHLIRHSVVTWLAEQGMNPSDLQGFARHDDISTTMNYVNSVSLRKRLPAEIRRFSPGNKI